LIEAWGKRIVGSGSSLPGVADVSPEMVRRRGAGEEDRGGGGGRNTRVCRVAAAWKTSKAMAASNYWLQRRVPSCQGLNLSMALQRWIGQPRKFQLYCTSFFSLFIYLLFLGFLFEGQRRWCAFPTVLLLNFKNCSSIEGDRELY